MSDAISGKTVLITGANRGIGKQILESFIQAGAAKIYAAVRDIASVTALQEKYGAKVQAITLDLSQPESIYSAAKQTPDVDIVVNNGGVLCVTTPFADNTIESLNFELEVNLYGLLHMARAFAPVLKKNGGGALVQLNSVASLRNNSKYSTYSTSKAAAYSMTQAIRDELKAQGTQVISVHPGPIRTDMAREAQLPEELMDPPKVVADGIIHALENNEFHVMPGAMAQELWQLYGEYAKSVIEVNRSESAGD